MTSAQEEVVEGIVLRSLEYRDRQRILTLFTRECGLVHLIVKGVSRRRLPLLALTSVFSQIECHFVRGRSELWRFLDGSLVNEHLALRKNFVSLKTAGEMAQGILRSQLPGKPAPALYALLMAYLGQVPLFEEPEVLLASFYLKVLKHEGSIGVHRRCPHCGRETTHLGEAGSACAEHAGFRAFPLTGEEQGALFDLCFAQRFCALREKKLPSGLLEKVEALFSAHGKA